MLHIEHFLDRLPAELSGGQQQRVALARALAKEAPLMLLDEPLVNLDYKLREELRDELRSCSRAGDSTVVYATTEPPEALLLGGYTAVLDAGRAAAVRADASRSSIAPASLRVARAFSDPPMNLMAGDGRRGRRARWPAAAWRCRSPATWPAARTARTRSACAPAHCACAPQRRATSRSPGTVELAEISRLRHLRPRRHGRSATGRAADRRARASTLGAAGHAVSRPGAASTCSTPTAELLRRAAGSG